MVKKELRIEKISLMPTSWDENMCIDKSFIGGILMDGDWYAFDIEIYYLETYGYNYNNEKRVFVTEISVIEN